jgi:hypothetical protein
MDRDVRPTRKGDGGLPAVAKEAIGARPRATAIEA